MGSGISTQRFEIEDVNCQIIKLQLNQEKKGYCLRINNIPHDFANSFQQQYSGKVNPIKKDLNNNYYIELQVYTKSDSSNYLTLPNGHFKAQRVKITLSSNERVFHLSKLTNLSVNIYA